MKPVSVSFRTITQDLLKRVRQRGWRALFVGVNKYYGCLHLRQFGRLGRRICSSLTVLTYLILGVPASTVLALQEPRGGDPFAGPPLRLTQTVLIRETPTGDPELTAPRALLTDASNIYVLDPVIFGVQRFDSFGNWLGTIGAEGDGPGEFRRPVNIGWSSDTLWVADLALGRLTLFDPESDSVVRNIQFRIASGKSVIVPQRMLGVSILGVPRYPSDVSANVDSVPFLLLDEDGSAQDTLAWQTTGRGTISILIDMGSDGGRSDYGTLTLSHPFDIRSLTAADSKGRWIYVGTWRTDRDRQDVFELVQISKTADTLGVVQLPFRRVAASRGVLDSYAEGAHRGLPEIVRGRLSAERLREELLRQVEDPRQATVDAMLVGADQKIWFRKTMRAGDEERQWTAYHFEQGFVGNVHLPLGHDLLAATGGLLWTVSRDGLGLPAITGWAVSWPESVRR